MPKGKLRDTWPSQARLREIFDYEDGAFIVKIGSGRRKAGDVTRGCRMSSGYYKITVDGAFMLMHQAVFLWHYGYVPAMIDHDDRDKGNNRIGNLNVSCYYRNSINSDRSEFAEPRLVGKFWVFEMSIDGVRYSGRGFTSKAEATEKRDTIKEALCRVES